MRLLGQFNSEKEIYIFSAFLTKEGIENSYEPFSEQTTGEKGFRLWIFDEDAFPIAQELLEQFRKNPEDPKYTSTENPLDKPLVPKTPLGTPPPALPSMQLGKNQWKTPLKVVRRPPFHFFLTQCFLVLCVFLFMWNQQETVEMEQNLGPIAAEIGMTPLQKSLFFDDPAAYQVVDDFLENCPIRDVPSVEKLSPEQKAFLVQAEQGPFWHGFYAKLVGSKNKHAELDTGNPPSDEPVPLFEKIRQGEVWRLFTPCLLHRDILHILFNMVWLWVLGKQMESRMSRLKMLLFIIIVGVVSNVMQYLMGGPYFLGFSGIVVGMVGFIWMRQKVAPWEGYPLQRSTILFIFFFVVAMSALELVSFTLEALSIVDMSANIANTAHIVGGLVGLLLGKTALFARKVGKTP